MNESLLYRCPDSILANRIINILDINSIEYRQVDETADQRTGAYGPSPGIAIYVLEKDYEEASALVQSVINVKSIRYSPFCPKCGSEDTVSLERPKYATPLLLVSILLFIVPCVYIYTSKGWDIVSWIALGIFILSIILMIIFGQINRNYKCNDCGKRFNRVP